MNTDPRVTKNVEAITEFQGEPFQGLASLCASGNLLYATDFGNDRICVFAHVDLDVLEEHGVINCAGMSPWGIGIDEETGNIVVTGDKDGKNVLGVFTKDQGARYTEIPQLGRVGFFAKKRALISPGVADISEQHRTPPYPHDINHLIGEYDDHVLLLDRLTRRAWRLNPDTGVIDKNVILTSGMIYAPNGMALDKTMGRLYISDTGLDGIHAFRRTKEGKYAYECTFGSRDDLVYPAAMAVLENGALAVVDEAYPTVLKVFQPPGVHWGGTE